MRLICVQFDYERSANYARLLSVFRASCARHMPAVHFESLALPAPNIGVGKLRSWGSNVYKLRRWAKIAAETAEPLILADCDMLCMRSIESAFDAATAGDFDIAYTKRTNERLPLNGGLVFVRPTAAARRFLARWREIDERMFNDPMFHRPWHTATCGMNQASFWYLVKKELPSLGARVVALPCAEWNACDEDWPNIDETTRVLHIKGRLRYAVLGETRIEDMTPDLQRAAMVWRECAQEVEA